MASVASEAAVASRRGNARTVAPSTEDAATAAWLAAIPCAAIVAVAILVLGPPLGTLFVPEPGTYAFLPEELRFVRPEPTEHARYLIALSAPLLATLAIGLGPRWQPRIPSRLADGGVVATQGALVGVVVAALVEQRHFVFGADYNGGEQRPFHLSYFSTTTFVVAALLAVAVTALVVDARSRARIALLLRDTRARRWIVAALVLVVTIAWMLPALQSDATIGQAPPDLLYHLQFPWDETFAVLNGRTPLVDFTAQYSSLWPFVTALSMTIFGKSLLAFTLTLATIGTLALLAVYDVLRRVTRSSVAALLLYLPFLASMLFLIGDTLENRSTVGTYFGTFPLRYAGAWFVAWLTVRQLARREPARAVSLWLLFTVAGLALLNNGDFGVAATGASVAALLWATPGSLRRAALLRLAGLVAAGLSTALTLVSLLTLARAGSLPQLERLVDYARLYALGSFALAPIPGMLGTHLLIYLTYVAAVAVATVRAVRHAANRALTGMLAWAGIFGLGAGSYYVGRSHPVALKHHFGAWSFALALLAVVAVGALSTQRARRTVVGALAVLFGFSVMACSLAQAPRPWSEIERLSSTHVPFEAWGSPEPFVPPIEGDARQFVAALADGPSGFVYQHGAPVAILLTDGHRIADAYGVVNVAPYTGIQSLQTVQRVEATLDALRDAGGNTVILPGIPEPGLYELLHRRGFQVLTAGGLRPYVEGRTIPSTQPWPIVGAVMRWVDTRHLHPRALR
ncbi:MAG TPA: hypothetical protein VFG31_07835 [Conexibacter sp.]|nr:hypothetical protein [Conexibacter sp.]